MTVELLPQERSGALLSANQISFSYGRNVILHDVGLRVNSGEIVALLGANGCGKSTLLQILLGLRKPAQGEVLLQGRPLSSYPRRQLARLMAYVPQHHSCPFPYRVRDVIAMGRYSHNGFFGRLSRSDEQQIDSLLEQFHISELAMRSYTEISGGQRQMVLLCRAILQGASLLILDEPASALDFGHQARLLRQLQQLADVGYAVVMTTHHPQHALMVASKVVLMKKGRIMGEGLPQTVLTDRQIAQLYDLTPEELRLVNPATPMEPRYAAN